MNKYGHEILTIDDWAELAFRNGDYEEANFLYEVIRDCDLEINNAEQRYRQMERREDELFCGMVHIKNLLEDLRTDVQQASRLNRKDILDRLREVLNDFGEYI